MFIRATILILELCFLKTKHIISYISGVLWIHLRILKKKKPVIMLIPRTIKKNVYVVKFSGLLIFK